MTIRDFMNYLIYIERSAENLQFFLWYRDYTKRFAEASTSDIALAPEWTSVMQEETMAKIQKEHMEKLRKDPPVASIFAGTDFEKRTAVQPMVAPCADPFSTPPSTSHDMASVSGSHVSQKTMARDAFAAAGVDMARPVVTSCGSGMTACVVAFALHRIGKNDVSLYDGSWAEWGADPDTPKARADA